MHKTELKNYLIKLFQLLRAKCGLNKNLKPYEKQIKSVILTMVNIKKLFQFA